MSFLKKGILIIFSLSLIFTSSVTVNAEAAQKLIYNPELENKPKLELVPERPNNTKVPSGRTMTSPFAVGGLSVLTSLALATEDGQKIHDAGAQFLTDIDYATYYYVHDTMAPALREKFEEFGQRYNSDLEATLHLTEQEFNSIKAFFNGTIEPLKYKHGITEENGLVTIISPHDGQALQPFNREFDSYYYMSDYIGYRYFDNSYPRHYHLIILKDKRFPTYSKWANLFVSTTGEIIGYSSIKDSTLEMPTLEAPNRTIEFDNMPSLHGYLDPLTHTINFPRKAPLEVETPKIVEIEDTKYFEVSKPNPQYNPDLAPDPFNNPESITEYTPVTNPTAEPIPELIPNPDYVPEPGEGGGGNEPPTGEEPILTDIFGPILPFFDFLIAMILYLIRLADFILTIPLVPQKPFPEPYGEVVEYFKNVRYGSVNAYDLMITVATTLFGFAVYKVIRRVIHG